MATVKYHISPSTGRPNLCRAEHSCPFGPPSEHYSSKGAAREAYEAAMNTATFQPLSKKVDSTDSKKSVLATDPAQDSIEVLEEAWEKYAPDKAWQSFPKYNLSGTEKKLVEGVLAGKKMSDEKLDLLLEEKGDLAQETLYNNFDDKESAQQLFGYIGVVRAQSGNPSTLATLDNFNPKEKTLFSNASARKNATVMGKAIRNAHAHAEWMYELVEQNNKAIEDRYWDEPMSSMTKEAYETQVAIYELAGRKAEARVQAQLKELQWCYDNDEAFKATVKPEIQSMLSQGWFRPQASNFDGLPIGRVGKIRS